MTNTVDRKESMSRDGYLRLHVQDDGDVVVCVCGECGISGDREMASVEFCTPYAGGGGSKRTWKALLDLAKAMAQDNADDSQSARRGEFSGADILKRFPGEGSVPT